VRATVEVSIRIGLQCSLQGAKHRPDRRRKTLPLYPPLSAPQISQPAFGRAVVLHHRSPPIEDHNPRRVVAVRLLVTKLFMEGCCPELRAQVRGNPAHEGDLASLEVRASLLSPKGQPAPELRARAKRAAQFGAKAFGTYQVAVTRRVLELAPSGL
jgi:hypothetical protein